jgi:hypothetical protein
MLLPQRGAVELTRPSVYLDIRDGERSRIIDLDVDIGADAVDYKYASPTALYGIAFTDHASSSVQLLTKSHYRPSKRRCASLRALSRKS